MADPFSDLANQSPEFIAKIVEGLELRAQDPAMIGAVDRYLEAAGAREMSFIVEVGSGSGPVARQIARSCPEAEVTGIEPSAEILGHAKRLAEGVRNLSFEVGDAADLPFDDGSVDLVVMHTLLSHVSDPKPNLAEAARVLRAGGALVIFDGDFSKGSLANFTGDPLHACAPYFAENFVTDAYLCGQLSTMVQAVGFDVRDFWMTPRLVRDHDGMIHWVGYSVDMMVERGQIGEELAAGLKAEYARRRDAGTLYAFQTYATLIARLP